MTSAVEGAHSIYRFIERTMERTPEGARWQTIDYGNQPQYSYQAFNGCGGIGIFLAEYGRQTGNEAALELAAEANLWCSTVELEGYERGLLVGRTGPALSWLYLSKVTGEPPSEHCHINAQTILDSERLGGRWNQQRDVAAVGGDASTGIAAASSSAVQPATCWSPVRQQGVPLRPRLSTRFSTIF